MKDGAAATRRRCPGHARHWFAPYGHPGLRLPKCIRCGAPNPRPLTTDDWQELAGDYFADLKTWTGEPMIEDVEALRESLNIREDVS
jgi:hypothetical protein